jgi:hypothetical protein
MELLQHAVQLQGYQSLPRPLAPNLPLHCTKLPCRPGTMHMHTQFAPEFVNPEANGRSGSAR